MISHTSYIVRFNFIHLQIHRQDRKRAAVHRSSFPAICNLNSESDIHDICCILFRKESLIITNQHHGFNLRQCLKDNRHNDDQ